MGKNIDLDKVLFDQLKGHPLFEVFKDIYEITGLFFIEEYKVLNEEFKSVLNEGFEFEKPYLKYIAYYFKQCEAVEKLINDEIIRNSKSLEVVMDDKKYLLATKKLKIKFLYSEENKKKLAELNKFQMKNNHIVVDLRKTPEDISWLFEDFRFMFEHYIKPIKIEGRMFDGKRGKKKKKHVYAVWERALLSPENYLGNMGKVRYDYCRENLYDVKDAYSNAESNKENNEWEERFRKHCEDFGKRTGLMNLVKKDAEIRKSIIK